MSTQRGGHLNYATADLGYTMWITPRASVSALVGYSYIGQEASAYGCWQIGGNPSICQPAIDNSTLVITEQTNFHSMRLGIAGEVTFFDRLRFNAEAAWLPFVKANGTDAHWLQIGNQFGGFLGPLPQDGRGDGFQVETSVAFQATKNFSIGAGWRLAPADQGYRRFRRPGDRLPRRRAAAHLHHRPLGLLRPSRLPDVSPAYVLVPRGAGIV